MKSIVSLCAVVLGVIAGYTALGFAFERIAGLDSLSGRAARAVSAPGPTLLAAPPTAVPPINSTSAVTVSSELAQPTAPKAVAAIAPVAAPTVVNAEPAPTADPHSRQMLHKRATELADSGHQTMDKLLPAVEAAKPVEPVPAAQSSGAEAVPVPVAVHRNSQLATLPTSTAADSAINPATQKLRRLRTTWTIASVRRVSRTRALAKLPARHRRRALTNLAADVGQHTSVRLFRGKDWVRVYVPTAFRADAGLD